jgi:UDP-glucuronate 4-epimerase
LTPILVTGTAGFIGFHFAKKLLDADIPVVGADNVNDYYDVSLKEARLAKLAPYQNHAFHRVDLADAAACNRLFDDVKPTRVVHFAAQAGVRYSIENPNAYIEANVVAFQNILENCRRLNVEHLLYASSSSVYGGNKKTPFSEDDPVDHPVSLYAATKRANELQAHAYSHLFGLPTTGLRFFTVYGPWGRPDMAMFLFTKRIIAGQPIDVFNHGKLERDFTYVDDIVESIARILGRPAAPDPNYDPMNPRPGIGSAPFRVFNIGNASPVPLERLISALENEIGKKALRNPLPMQPGDVYATHADVSALEAATGYRPKVSIEEGARHFVKWYRDYYRE